MEGEKAENGKTQALRRGKAPPRDARRADFSSVLPGGMGAKRICISHASVLKYKA